LVGARFGSVDLGLFVPKPNTLGSCRNHVTGQMTAIKHRGTGAAVPLVGSQAVALAILCTLLFLTFLDNTIVSVGLGSVQADLHAGVLALQWVVGAYALTFASAMLAFGMVGDDFGRKKVMLAGAGVSCAGSVLCALAFQSIGVNAIETGGVPPSGTTSSAGGPGNAAIVQQVINAAYHAFGTGLHAALYLAAGLVIGAGILTAVTLRPSARPGGRSDAAGGRHQ
jgi:MFS family permease